MAARVQAAVTPTDGLAPTIDERRGLRLLWAWGVCVLRHRPAHRWYPRYLDGYGECVTCGRQWA